MHGNRTVSTKNLARQIGVKSVAPCKPEVANRHSGYLVGGTSPFGTRREMPVYIEETILALPRIAINGGRRGYLVGLDPQVIAPLSEETQVLQSIYPALAVLAAYLLGSLSFAVIVSRAMGLKDPRTFGSKNPGATQALVVGGQAVAMQNQLNFSRDMEREADRIGYGLMAPAGFAPQGFVSMFDKLQQANRLNDNGSWPYLRSHPLTTERMADMHSRLPPGEAAAAATVPSTLEHAMVAARARVLANPGVDNLRQWIAEPQGSGFAALPASRRVGVLYAAALGSNQLRDAAGARAAAKKLEDLVRNDAAAHRLAKLLAAEIELAAGDAAAAVNALAADANNTSSGSSSNRRPELVLRTQALLR
eukprot:gene46579-58078_t